MKTTVSDKQTTVSDRQTTVSDKQTTVSDKQTTVSDVMTVLFERKRFFLDTGLSQKIQMSHRFTDFIFFNQ